ncbi:hypothetical protein G7Y89_g12359 [Cudoniella acicularis]|uniref:Dienelactone hydrolase domain-containing protein n=1 Tax=Cudoniella acicularis TaxID=354080 RepID=A0A8H4R984_9HELO|nr:hypothetical protein G7Y89_g12359 [Cudoniella acicularis]
MAEPEVATKAPESDAMETTQPQPSLIPGDTPAQSGASLGTDRLVSALRILLASKGSPQAAYADLVQSASGQGPSGEMTQLGGVDTYVSKPTDYPQSPSKLLLLLTGATGLHSQNNQIQADAFAKEGFLVVMPDMFSNDPLPGSATYEEEKDPSVIEQIKMRAAETAKSFLIDMWLARQTPEKVLPILHKIIEAAKDEFADAVANGGGIYSVGYCFGGRMTLLLAGEKPDTVAWGQQVKDEEAGVVKKGPYIKAGAIAHATLVTKEDFEGTKVPLTFVCVENDQLFADEIREHGEDHLKQSNIENEFKIYSGVPHGFGVASFSKRNYQFKRHTPIDKELRSQSDENTSRVTVRTTIPRHNLPTTTSTPVIAHQNATSTAHFCHPHPKPRSWRPKRASIRKRKTRAPAYLLHSKHQQPQYELSRKEPFLDLMLSNSGFLAECHKHDDRAFFLECVPSSPSHQHPNHHALPAHISYSSTSGKCSFIRTKSVSHLTADSQSLQSPSQSPLRSRPQTRPQPRLRLASQLSPEPEPEPENGASALVPHNAWPHIASLIETLILSHKPTMSTINLGHVLHDVALQDVILGVVYTSTTPPSTPESSASSKPGTEKVDLRKRDSLGVAGGELSRHSGAVIKSSSKIVEEAVRLEKEERECVGRAVKEVEIKRQMEGFMDLNFGSAGRASFLVYRVD